MDKVEDINMDFVIRSYPNVAPLFEKYISENKDILFTDELISGFVEENNCRVSMFGMWITPSMENLEKKLKSGK